MKHDKNDDLPQTAQNIASVEPESVNAEVSSPETTSQPEKLEDKSSEEKSSEESTSEDSRPVKKGTVKLLFTLKKGNFHGYIAPDDGSKDILFHQKYINADIFSDLERGAQVSATVKYIEGKAYATYVELAESSCEQTLSEQDS